MASLTKEQREALDKFEDSRASDVAMGAESRNLVRVRIAETLITSPTGIVERRDDIHL